MQGLTLFHFFSRTRLQSETIFVLSSRSIRKKQRGYIATKCNRLSNKAISYSSYLPPTKAKLLFSSFDLRYS